MIDDLHEERPNTPPRTPPFSWRTTDGVEANMARVQSMVGLYEGLLPHGVHIDEAAILVPNPYKRALLQSQLVNNNWRLSGSSEDVVYTNPFGTRYAVQYVFLTHPEMRWRLEVMNLTTDAHDNGGISPLHAALYVNGAAEQASASYPVPHLSYKPQRRKIGHKVDGTPSYQSVLESFSAEVVRLRDQGCIHAMTCQSSYGAFAYYRPTTSAWQLYLKPRVNLRDAGEAA